ncbi:MAG: hypothetical protein GYB68_14465 [Chloroflexi bacterium]|nr:hypothetical protein [Chloroflexota bacterium]
MDNPNPSTDFPEDATLAPGQLPNPSRLEDGSFRTTAFPDSAVEAMRKAALNVMEIDSVTLVDSSSAQERLPQSPMIIRGKLRVSAEAAFSELRPKFEQVGHTPMLRQEDDGLVALRALPMVFNQKRGIAWGPLILLIITLISVFLVGVGGELYVPFPTAVQYVINDIEPNPEIIPPDRWPSDADFWRAMGIGGLYTLSLLGILGAHEMGHYLVARRYKVDVSPPFFIPLPIGILGTMGAVIAMREPAPNRKIQFDIGVAGPLAGLVLAIPIVLVGLSLSEVSTIEEVRQTLPPSLQDQLVTISEGQSLVYLGAKLLIFGEILPNGERDVWIHPIAFAGWAGLLVTALNLIPIGQLDGGHVMYGLVGKQMNRLRVPVIAALFSMAIIGSIRDTVTALPAEAFTNPLFQILQVIANSPLPGWSGWWLWGFLLLFLVRQHAPVLDEITELDPNRRALGIAMIVIFVLIFTPVPLVINTAL